MKNRTTIILLLSIVLLGGFIWMQETWRSKVPSREYRRIKLFDLDPATLVSVQFKSTNSLIECTRDGEFWSVAGTGRSAGRADAARIQQMVAGINAMGKGTTITADHLKMRGLNMAEYGFDQPMYGITVVDNQGRRGWEVGRKAPLGNMVYVRVAGGEEIYTVPDKLLQVIPSSSDQLRDRAIFAGVVPGVRRVEIRGQAGFIQLLKDARNGWHMQQPVSAPADASEVDRYIQLLNQLLVEEFVEENVSDFSVYGLQGDRQISLGGVDGTSRMLLFGDEIAERPGYIYARRADDTSVFALKAEALELLNVPVNRFRNAALLSFKPADVSGILISHGEKQLELNREDGGLWQIRKPVSWEAASEPVAALLKIWSEAVITDFDVQVPMAAEPEWTLLFGAHALGQTNRIMVYPPEGKKDGLVVRREGDKAFCRINLPSIPGEAADPLVFKDKTIWRIERSSIQRVSIQRPESGEQIIERAEDGSFKAGGSGGSLAIDAPAVERILNLLSVLETSGYVSYNPRELEIYGLAAPALQLQVGLSGTGELGRVLMLGHETPHGYYAMVKGHDVVFYLSSRAVNILSQSMLAQPAGPIPAMEE